MKKYIRFNRPADADRGSTIDIDKVIAVRPALGSNTNIEILMDMVTHSDASAPELAVFTLTLTGANLTGTEKDAVVANVLNSIANSYQKSWTNPLEVITEVSIGSSNRDVDGCVFGKVAL